MPTSEGAETKYELVQFPDLPPPSPNLDESEQLEVMVLAAENRGGLRKGEDLTALPSGTPNPGHGWKHEDTVTASESYRKYDVYTRLNDDPPSKRIDFSDSEGEVITASHAEPPAVGALRDIDQHFSPSARPDDTTVKCAVGFAKGFVKGAVVGYGVGFALAALGPAGAAIGVGLLLYSVYEVATNWEAIADLPPEKKAELAGDLIGGMAGGGLGARGGTWLRGKLLAPKWKGPADYSELKNPRGAGPGKKVTATQKKKMYAINREHNDGLLRDDRTGEILAEPKKSLPGETPPPTEAQIDHVHPRSKGGTNEYENLEVRSRKNNRDKWDK